MRIGIDASRANLAQRTGTEWYAFHLTKAFFQFVRPSDTVRLYVKEPLRPEWGTLPKNVEVRVLGWPPKFLWTQLRLSAELLRHRVDVLFVPAHTIPFLAPRNTVTTLHDIGFEHAAQLYGQQQLGPSNSFKPWLNACVRLFTLGRYGATELDYHRFSARRALQHCQTILTVSEYTKQDICQTYGIEPQRVRVIPNAIDTQAFHPSVRQDTARMAAVATQVGLRQPYIMTIGRIEKKKNTLGLVQAFIALKKNPAHARLQLLLVGKPGVGASEITSAIHAAGLTADVFCPGWLPEADIPALMAGASAFVLPSFFEGFGIPVLEAMAVGTPVVCSAVTSLPEVAGDAAVLVDPHDPQAIADGVASVLADPEKQKLLQERGYTRVQQFSWARSAAQLAKVLFGQ
ncbi:MAG: glycosyltransferase family 1 protein [Patescibacteria group bacterium]